MEVELDMKGLDKACVCGSGKKAGSCCKKDEPCACGSGDKAGECCFREEKKPTKS